MTGFHSPTGLTVQKRYRLGLVGEAVPRDRAMLGPLGTPWSPLGSLWGHVGSFWYPLGPLGTPIGHISFYKTSLGSHPRGHPSQSLKGEPWIFEGPGGGQQEGAETTQRSHTPNDPKVSADFIPERDATGVWRKLILFLGTPSLLPSSPPRPCRQKM